jgi:hypothetical protein
MGIFALPRSCASSIGTSSREAGMERRGCGLCSGLKGQYCIAYLGRRLASCHCIACGPWFAKPARTAGWITATAIRHETG